ncbi:hypothetical protein [Dactylosporangium darangshiense]
MSEQNGGPNMSEERQRRLAALRAWHAEWAEKWGVDASPYEGQSLADFDARITPEAEADYQRHADEIMGVTRPEPEPLRIPEGMGPIPIVPVPLEQAPPAAADAPLARTPSEALFYLELQPCPRCGERRTAWSSALSRLDGGTLAERYFGACGNCGEQREYVFRLPERHLPRPAGADVFYGGPEPSQLFDPGQWLGMADPLLEQIRADIAAGDTAAARQHTEVAWVHIDEALKFVPDGADAVPESAFWTEAGRERYRRDPRRFTRRRLLLLQEMLRTDVGAPSWASAPDAPGTPGGIARPPLARTSAEAHLYLDLQPCVCGATRAQWRSQVRGLDGDLAREYEASCPQCGRDRRFVFRLPQEPPAPSREGADFSYGDGPHSELIDPGQWLGESDRLARSVPMLPAGADAAQRERFRFAIGRAAAALSEAARFAPPGASAVPEEACFTEAGRALFRAEPGRFRLDRLAAVRGSYLQLLELAER